jgi:MFS family permease
VGALAAGELADRIGRERTVLIAGTVFTLRAEVQVLLPGTMMLVAGRLIIGAGIGVAAVAAPFYAAELSALPPPVDGSPLKLRLRFIKVVIVTPQGSTIIDATAGGNE